MHSPIGEPRNAHTDREAGRKNKPGKWRKKKLRNETHPDEGRVLELKLAPKAQKQTVDGKRQGQTAEANSIQQKDPQRNAPRQGKSAGAKDLPKKHRSKQ